MNGAFRRLALVLAGVSLVLVQAIPAAAASGNDSGQWSHGGCQFDGSISYNTTPPPWGYYGYAATYSTCATFVVCNAYFWDPAISDFRQSYSNWQNTLAECPYNVAATTNVYGYHQIRYPSGSYSTTYETHP